MILVLGVWAFVRALIVGSAAVSLENVPLRHQLAVLQRSVGRPQLRPWDRLVWVGLSQLWAGWRASLVIVQPATASPGTAKASSSTGAGSPGAAQRVVLRSILSSARSSAAWPERTRPGAGAGFKPNPGSSAMRSPGSPLPSTCGARRRGHPRCGAPSTCSSDS